MEKFLELRKKYDTFKFEKYSIVENENTIDITYYYEIIGLEKFIHKISIEKTNMGNSRKYKDYKKEYQNMAFSLGMIEIVNYLKITCSKNVIIECGSLDQYQKEWFKKIYYNGLGEFRYINNIKIDEKDLFEISSIKLNEQNKIKVSKENQYINEGNLIPIGGGKDSVVTAELLKGMHNKYIILNPRKATIECTKQIENGVENTVFVKRVLDKKILELNEKDFLNGHIPFSAILAFITYIVAFASGKKHIALSNESSANEPNIPGTKINHQYSKSFEFECDFIDYTEKYFQYNIEYFSFLRPLNELQITKIFSRQKKYFKVFRSCNVGSKTDIWCNNCPKCLFVYIMLNIYLESQEMLYIFNENLLEKRELLQTFLELSGKSENKPFECVGTIAEVNYAIKRGVKKIQELKTPNTEYGYKYPYLLEYYIRNFDENITENENKLVREYNSENNLTKEFEDILKKEI